MLKIIISGDRYWVGQEIENIMTSFLNMLPPNVTILHGGCSGVDQVAEKTAQALGIKTEIFPADWTLGRKAGPIRNKKMLDQDVAAVYLFHRNLSQSKGTLNMYNLAKLAGVPTFLIQ